MTRARPKPASLPSQPSPGSGCPLEALGREFVALRPLEEAPSALLGMAAFHRRDAIMRAAPQLQAKSALGCLFQLLLAAINESRLSVPFSERPTFDSDVLRADIRSCVYSIAAFLEGHFGVDRTQVTADYDLDDHFSPFNLQEVPLPSKGSAIGSVSE